MPSEDHHLAQGELAQGLSEFVGLRPFEPGPDPLAGGGSERSGFPLPAFLHGDLAQAFLRRSTFALLPLGFGSSRLFEKAVQSRG